ncbi:MAG: glucosaminidase domain-containing protein [Candidatus Eremiobacteraeota bacterium]|nr:glucosaminidase domain-containing protein [Candidatus Eremiobacteraeota bacterium]MCW5866311.1 glucosaminidase domain-containing protein [Candidatus Eremiobacteraeota bacterium]
MDTLNITNININLGPQQPAGFPGLGSFGSGFDTLALQRLPQPTALAPISYAPASAPPGGGLDATAQMAQITTQLMKMLLKLMKNKPKKKKKKAKGGGKASQTPGAGATGGTTVPRLASTADGQAIDKYLSKQGSKAGNAQFGELAIKYGQQYDVDPMILLAIAGHETRFGTTGVGLNGLLGVGAYDSDPNNSTRNSKFSGVEQQLKVGAETFANLRKKGGASASDPIEKQTAAVNKAGWASDPNWHNGVDRMYKQVTQAVG